MDPLSITASTVTLIEAASKLRKVCMSYKTALRGCSPEDALIRQLDDLRRILDDLLRLEQDFTDQNGFTSPSAAGSASAPLQKTTTDRLQTLRNLVPELLSSIKNLDSELALPSWVQ